MFPGISSEKISADRLETPVEQMRRSVKEARRRLAFQLRDYFNTLEQMTESEFLEVVSELDGDGIVISQMVEKHKKYIRTDKV